MSFDTQDIPDQSGKIIVITGANGGIGFEAARMLAGKNARVVLACRDEKRMADAAARLVAEVPTAQIDQLVLDLSSLASVRAAAQKLAAMHPRIDVLINNAGVMAIPMRTTADGFEMQVGTNHFGHFAFTGLVLPLLHGEGRVVTVSSIMHKFGKIDFDAFPVPAKYSPRNAYSMSKLANLLFMYELDRKLQAAGAQTRSVACHPGYSATGLQAVGPTMSGSKLSGWMMNVGNNVFAQSAHMGALPTVYAATAPDVNGGEYFGPKSWFETRGYPEKVSSNAASRDVAVAKKLWEVSEQATGVPFAFSFTHA